MSLVRGCLRQQAGLRPFGQNPVRRTGCRARQGDSPAARQAHPCAEPARKAADHRRDGSRLCAAVYANLSSVLRSARRRARYSGGAVLHHPQPRLLRRVQLLRAGVPSGTVHSGAQPRERDRGSKKDHPNARIQGIHPRCRRPDREFPLSGLQKAGEIRLLQGQALPVPHHLSEHRGRPHGLPRTAA